MTFTKIMRLAVATAAASLCCTLANAADTQSMAVSASVQGICKLTSVPAMGFGSLDPSATADATASSAVIYKCTKGTSPTSFSVGASTTGTYNGTLTSGTTADTIPYAVTWTAPSTAGTGLGTAITGTTVTLSGTILNANYVNVTAASYAQSVAIVIAP